MDDIHFNTTLGNIFISFRDKPKDLKKRDFEKTEIHRILSLLDIPIESLSYGFAGNPILSLEDYYVSISHSEGWFAVYLANEPIGIDIQVIHKRIAEGKSYFTNEQEQNFKSEFDLHLIWAAKEAIYKKYLGNMKDLAKEVTVRNLDISNRKIKVDYNNKVESLIYREFENTFLVYTE